MKDYYNKDKIEVCPCPCPIGSRVDFFLAFMGCGFRETTSTRTNSFVINVYDGMYVALVYLKTLQFIHFFG